jgi:hypothetical protein
MAPVSHCVPSYLPLLHTHLHCMPAQMCPGPYERCQGVRCCNEGVPPGGMLSYSCTQRLEGLGILILEKSSRHSA